MPQANRYYERLRTTLIVLGALAALVAVTDTGEKPILKRHIFSNELVRSSVFVAGAAAFMGGILGEKKR